ncbi:MAG: Transcription factor WhiB-like protein [Pseudonocardiales bacterium]|nr:Transcription factor WhiB-like protein [Pseudonocardiales bacterium]
MTATLPARDTAHFDVRTWDGMAGFESGHQTGTLELSPSWVDNVTPAHLRSDLPCQVEDSDLWFAETPAQLESAKASCAPCPLRASCLAGALERREPWGVWGGEILERGAVIARKRPRGRPRKEAA